jgi:hypothetical protein
VNLKHPRGLAIFTAFCGILVLSLTAGGIPIVWDEGEYLWRSDQVAAWFARLASFDVAAFSREAIRSHWPFVDWEEGHPAFGAIPLALLGSLFKPFFGPLFAARLGTIAVFSAACGVVAFRLKERYGTAAALGGVVSLLTLPRLFAEAHFATLDAQLSAWWLILWAVDSSRRSSPRRELATGLLGGLTMATKFTGGLAWVSLVTHRLLSGDRHRRIGLLLVVPVGIATFVLVNPPVWYHPFTAMSTFVRLNLHRELNVPVAFMGGTYDLSHPLPWYNTLVWLAIAVPVPTLVLGTIGLAGALRTRESASTSLIVHWASLMIARALPGTPPHDGIRLILPAFAFWCVLAGIGTQRVWDWSVAYGHNVRRMLVRAVLAASLLSGVVTLVRYYPQTLSHYNLLAGGVRGAAALGFEPTYWWDSLDFEVLEWLNAHTEATEFVAFSSIANMTTIHNWGWLKPRETYRHGIFKWYVFQNRTSFLAPTDRYLIEHERPAFVKYAGRHAPDSVPWDLNVPLLYIYSFEQYQRAVAAVSPGQ